MTVKDEYYRENSSKRSYAERVDLFLLEGREATGLLLSAARAVAHDTKAVAILNRLRDELIEDFEVNGPESWADCNKTLFLYRRNQGKGIAE